MDWKHLDRTDRIDAADEIAAAMKKTGSLGERIKIVRFVYDMKQTEFARAIGVSRSYLSEVENEKGKPSIEMIVGIAQHIIYLNNNWLLTGDGSVHAPIVYDRNGFSILPERSIDYNVLNDIIGIIEEKMGENWLCRQKGARRKTEIITYFYEMYVTSYRDAAVVIGNTPRVCREKAEAACMAALDQMGELGLPSIRHKPLED